MTLELERRKSPGSTRTQHLSSGTIRLEVFSQELTKVPIVSIFWAAEEGSIFVSNSVRSFATFPNDRKVQESLQDDLFREQEHITFMSAIFHFFPGGFESLCLLSSLHYTFFLITVISRGLCNYPYLFSWEWLSMSLKKEKKKKED